MEKRHIKTFQGLRWFACLLVFLSHSVPGFVLSGKFATVVFFCLSGFLAQMKFKNNVGRSATILRNCKNNFLHYAQKFFPLHWVILIFISIPSILYKSDSYFNLIIKFILNAALLQSWVPNMSFAYSFNGVSWYLSVALFFAFISPFIVEKVAKLSWKQSIVFLAIIWCFQLGIAFCSISELDLLTYVFPPIRVMDCVAGCLMFQVCKTGCTNCKKQSVNSIFFLSLIAVVGLVLVANFVPDLSIYGAWFSVAIWSLPAWGFVFSLFYEEKLFKFIKFILTNRLITYLGDITFEFYLIHKAILNCGSEGFRIFLHREADFVMVIIAFLVSLSLSIAIHAMDKCIRKKIKKKKLKKSRSVVQ